MADGLTEIARLKIDEVDDAGRRCRYRSRTGDGRLRRVFMADDYGECKRTGLAVRVVALDREGVAALADRRRAAGAVAPVDGRGVVRAAGIEGVGFGSARIGEGSHRLVQGLIGGR